MIMLPLLSRAAFERPGYSAERLLGNGIEAHRLLFSRDQVETTLIVQRCGRRQ
jgi:hypothetical protein